MAHGSFDTVISNLNAWQVGKQFRAVCPACGDENPSLSIKKGNNGMVLLYCHAGCDYQKIASSIGWIGIEKDLYGPCEDAPKVIFQTEHLYHDEEGRQCEKVTRTEYDKGPKDMKRYHLNNGKWKAGSSNKKLQPYRFAEWKNEEEIIIVEGEKCADRLWREGIAATTTGGCKSWEKRFANYFKDKVVYLLPDYNDVGFDYVKLVFSDIQNVAKKVLQIELPDLEEGDDIVDWLEAGNTIEQLIEIKGKSEEAKTVLERVSPQDRWFVRLDTVEPTAVDFLWKNYIPKGKVTGLVGDPGCGKSQIVAHIVACVSRGLPLPGCSKSEKGTAIIFNSEDDISDTTVPRLLSQGADLNKIEVCSLPLSFSDEKAERIFLKIKDKKPSIVIFDPIQCYIGAINMNQANEVRTNMQKLMALAKETGCAVIIVMHMSKSNFKASYRALGSIDFVGSIRSMLVVGKSQDDENIRALLHKKSNCGPLGVQLGFKVMDGVFKWIGPTNFTEKELFGAEISSGSRSPECDEAEEFLRSELADGPKQSEELNDSAIALGITKRTLARAKKKLGTKARKAGKNWLILLPEN